MKFKQAKNRLAFLFIWCIIFTSFLKNWTTMTNGEAIVELRQFLDNFSILGAELTKEKAEVSDFNIPIFKLPYWTDVGQNIDCSLGLRRIWWPEKDVSSNLTRIRKRIVVVEIRIMRDGSVVTTCRNPLDLENKIQFSSQNAQFAVQCFIVFNQLLAPALKRLRKEMSKIARTKKLDKHEQQQLSAAIKASFEPLVPFIVLDKLSE